MAKKSASERLLIFALCSYLVVGETAGNWTCVDPCSEDDYASKVWEETKMEERFSQKTSLPYL